MRKIYAGDLNEKQRHVFSDYFYSLDGSPGDHEGESPWGCPWISDEFYVLGYFNNRQFAHELEDFEIESLVDDYVESYKDEWIRLENEEEKERKLHNEGD
jgi:hypothetical protein